MYLGKKKKGDVSSIPLVVSGKLFPKTVTSLLTVTGPMLTAGGAIHKGGPPEWTGRKEANHHPCPSLLPDCRCEQLPHPPAVPAETCLTTPATDNSFPPSVPHINSSFLKLPSPQQENKKAIHMPLFAFNHNLLFLNTAVKTKTESLKW